MNWLILTVTLILGIQIHYVDSQCYGMHCAGNGLGLTSSLLSYLQLGGGLGGGQLGQGRYYRRYKERVKSIPDDMPPIRAAIAELEEERRTALGIDDEEEEEEYYPKRRRGFFRRRKNRRRNRRGRRSERDRIVQMSEAQQNEGYSMARSKVNAMGFLRSTILG